MIIGLVFAAGAGFESERKLDGAGTPVMTDSSEVDESTVLAVVLSVGVEGREVIWSAGASDFGDLG